MSQMIQDGSFEEYFVPAYQKAVQNNSKYMTFEGQSYELSIAYSMINLAKAAGHSKASINLLKSLEK